MDEDRAKKPEAMPAPEREARRRIARNPLRLYLYYLLPLAVLAALIYYFFGAGEQAG